MRTFRLLKTTLLVFVVVGTFVVYSNIVIQKAGKTGVFSISESPQADVAIVLGARVYKSGMLSPVLADRVDTGIDLYQNGKVKKLLLTGDHGQVTYDEVNNMRLYALEQGIPEADIFMDHAGFSTYDSMHRARDVFLVKKAIIVTQEFHLPRALYLARSMGLEASGVQADKRIYVGQEYLNFRELFARTKAVAQLALRMKPKYLGQEIPISGDGKTTLDGVKI